MSQTTILRPRARTGSVLREADGSTFTFDATVSESPSHKGKLTKHPVEEGADVSDHYQDEPDQLTIVAGVTNSPLPAQGEPLQNRDLALYRELVAIKRRGEPITVVTGLEVYPNMVITSIDLTRDPGSGQALMFTVGLEEVILTTTESVDIPADNQRRKGGRQNAEAVHVNDQSSAEAESATAQLDAGAASASAQQTAEDPEGKATRDKETSTLAGIL